MGNFLSNLVKMVLVGGLVYGAYKVGEDDGLEKGRRNVMSDNDKDEIDHLKQLIDELNAKKNKTKSDEYNLSLLEEKLYDLENE